MAATVAATAELVGRVVAALAVGRVAEELAVGMAVVAMEAVGRVVPTVGAGAAQTEVACLAVVGRVGVATAPAVLAKVGAAVMARDREGAGKAAPAEVTAAVSNE